VTAGDGLPARLRGTLRTATATRSVRRLASLHARLHPRLTALGRAVFRDRRGLLVFLFAAAAAMLLWRTTVSINDNYTVINGLVAVSRGQPYVAAPTFGETLASPGMVRVDGRAVPRNFAHIVLSLPALWLLQGVELVADLRVAAAGAWSGLLLALGVTIGDLAGRERVGRVGGSVVALVAFAANVAVATPLEPVHPAFLALQLTTVVVAGLCAVLVYRTLARLHGDRVGLAAGLAVALASPGLLWASIPKRHVLTAAFALATLYALVRSREANQPRARRFRALAYVPVGLTAWLHAAEGFALLLALVVVDAVTARRNDPRTLVTVAAAFALSLVPMLVTNALVAGDPLTVPRMLPPYDSGSDAVRFVSEGGGGSGSGGGVSWLPSVLVPLVDATLRLAEPLLAAVQRGLVFVTFVERGVDAATGQPSKLYHTFLRSGYVGTEGRGATGLAINLAFVEALPLAGAVVAAPVVAVRRWRRDGSAPLRDRLAGPHATADLFAVAYGIVLTLVYLRRFPIHASITVRYIYPLFPLAVYAVARLPAARAVVHERPADIAFTYAGGVLVGGQLTLLVVVVNGYGVDEAMQGYALLAVAVAGLLAAWSLAATLGRRGTRVGAVLFGIAGAVTTNVLCLFAYYYFGRAFLLPIVPV
jgi:hypothetical protein